VSISVKARLKALLPQALARAVDDFRNISSGARVSYLRLWARRVLRIPEKTRMPSTVRSVLMVCHGNIIRSPMAAVLLRKYLADRRCTAISVSSAGTHAPLGASADERAVLLSREYGVSLESHRTQPLTASLVGGSDFILVMDRRNEAELLARYPEARDKVFLLGAVRSRGRSRTAEIPDPHFGTLEDVRRCFAALQTGVERLAIVLASTETNP